MGQGWIISGLAHLILIAVALFGLPETMQTAEIKPAQVTDVSIVSLSDFQAARSAAPSEPETPDIALQAPKSEQSEAVTPETESPPETVEVEKPNAPEAGEAPDVSALDVVSPNVSVDIDSPIGADDAAPLGIETPLPNAPAQDGSINSNNLALLAPQTPNLAPRIDTSAAPKPPKPVPDAPTVVPEASPDPEPEPIPEPKPEEPAAAPKEATTEITPDAVVEERPTTPKAAARPKGRPANLRAEAERKEKEAAEREAAQLAAQKADEERQAAEKAKKDAEAAAVAAALKAAQETSEPVETGTRLGQNFNSSEARAVGDVIGSYWNKGRIEGKDQYERLVVTVRVRLTAEGKILGAVEPIDPRSPSGDFKIAFEAARSAVLQAINRKGLPLPRDKFRDGDFLEIRFDPGRSAISLE